MSETVLCPACGKVIAVKGIPKHTNGCPKWAEVIGVPPSQFNFNRHYKRGVWADGTVEGIDYVTCLLCPDVRVRRLADHLKFVHDGMTIATYQGRFPGASVVATGSLDQRKATVQAKYGVDNVSQADEVRILLRANDHSQSPEARLKRRLTNLERFGHENPFGGEQGKLRAQGGMKARYGVAYPQQDPVIRERMLETTKVKYGSRFFFQTDAFKVKFVETSMERFGADHPMKSEKGMKLFTSACQDSMGTDSPFSNADVQRRCYASNLANHGGKHSQQCHEVLEKARATWLEKYGVDNPSKVEEIKAKIKDVWMGKYGVPFPPQSLWINQTQSFPNGLEKQVIAMNFPCIVYAGDGSYWVRSPGVSRARNPDFVVLSQDQLRAYQAGTKLNELRTFAIVEIFGDYFHGPKFTGKDRSVHAHDVEDFYRSAGITCLIVWEDELKKHPKRVGERLASFLVACERG